MLPFAATMDLLAAAGVPVAPYHLVRRSRRCRGGPFAGPYVVKLADVAHRTEHGAVRLGVTAEARRATAGSAAWPRGTGCPRWSLCRR